LDRSPTKKKKKRFDKPQRLLLEVPRRPRNEKPARKITQRAVRRKKKKKKRNEERGRGRAE